MESNNKNHISDEDHDKKPHHYDNPLMSFPHLANPVMLNATGIVLLPRTSCNTSITSICRLTRVNTVSLLLL